MEHFKSIYELNAWLVDKNSRIVGPVVVGYCNSLVIATRKPHVEGRWLQRGAAAGALLTPVPRFDIQFISSQNGGL